MFWADGQKMNLCQENVLPLSGSVMQMVAEVGSSVRPKIVEFVDMVKLKHSSISALLSDMIVIAVHGSGLASVISKLPLVEI